MAELQNMSPADIKALLADPNQSGMGGNGIWLILLLTLLGGRNNLYGNQENAVGINANIREDKYLDFRTFEKVGDSITQNVQGFMGASNQLCQTQFNLQSEINGVRNALAQCCCEIKGDIRDSEFRTAQLINDSSHGIERQMTDFKQDVDTQLCDARHQAEVNKMQIIAKVEETKDTVIAYLNQTKLDELNTENIALKHEISQAAQTAALIASCGCGCPGTETLINK